MSFGHERRDAYRAAIEYVGWEYRLYGGAGIDPDAYPDPDPV